MMTKTTKILTPTIDRKIAALRAARLSADAADEPKIAEWFDQSVIACKAKKMPMGRLHITVGARGIPGAMAFHSEKNTIESTPLAALKEKDLLEWSLEAGIVKFADYFRRHFGDNIVALAQARLDEVGHS
jgi:hypothetical protein